MSTGAFAASLLQSTRFQCAAPIKARDRMSGGPPRILDISQDQYLTLINKWPAEAIRANERRACDKKVAQGEICVSVLPFDFGQLYFGSDRLTSKGRGPSATDGRGVK